MIHRTGDSPPTPLRNNDYAQASDKYCVFEQSGTLYAIYAMSVREICARPPLAIVPESPGILAGVAHLRNEFLPLVRDTPGNTATERRPREQQVVVLLNEQGPWGLLVERAVGLCSLDVSLCHESQGQRGWASAIMGSATLDHRVVRILDDRTLYRSIADELNRQWSRLQAPASA